MYLLKKMNLRQRGYIVYNHNTIKAVRMTQVEIRKDGSVRVYDEENKEYVRVLLQLKEDDTLNVGLKVKEQYVYTNKLYPKPPLNMKAITDLIEEDLQVDEEYTDIARTTPEFASHYNNILSTILDDSEVEVEVNEGMDSYRSGYSFIGEAFINFVISLVVYHSFPEEDSTSLLARVNLLRSNYYLACVSMNSGWARYLALPSWAKHSETHRRRMIAASFKGLVGSLYEANGIEKMFEIMKFIKKTITPELAPELFNTSTSIRPMVTYLSTILVSTLFGWFVCYISLTMHTNTYKPFQACYVPSYSHSSYLLRNPYT